METRYKGRDGSLVVDGEFIIIEHNDKSIPDNRVLQSSLTDVHYERATRWTSGIVTIAVDGVPLVVPLGSSAGGDPNTVVFKHAANDTFFGVQEWLKQVVAENLSRTNPETPAEG